MNVGPNSQVNRRATTLVEVGFVVAALLVLGLLFVPALSNAKAKARRSSCICHLKQIGLAMRMYANDHGARFPWRVPVSETGTLEYALSPQTFRLYLVASNELNTPKILWCSTDKQRTRTGEWSQLGNSNLSYFIALDSEESAPQMILSGDRNIAGGSVSNGVMTVAATNRLMFTKAMHNGHGNIGLADGSAMQVTSAGLQQQLSNSMLPVVRFAIP